MFLQQLKSLDNAEIKDSSGTTDQLPEVRAAKGLFRWV